MPNDDPRDTADSKDAKPEEKLPPPGPADHGNHGGMATRENAPELAAGNE